MRKFAVLRGVSRSLRVRALQCGRGSKPRAGSLPRTLASLYRDRQTRASDALALAELAARAS
ncbi:hypothetical protein PSP6_60216 [Paraburkholderia tropica]|nr:hypothetical protein PSP6_60216 [Paraburkholderia tropica]